MQKLIKGEGERVTKITGTHVVFIKFEKEARKSMLSINLYYFSITTFATKNPLQYQFNLQLEIATENPLQIKLILQRIFRCKLK